MRNAHVGVNIVAEWKKWRLTATRVNRDERKCVDKV